MKTAHNKYQEHIAGEKMSVKQIQNLKIEGRLLKQIEELKKEVGPFTNPQEIDGYLENKTISEKLKLKRIKTEVMYAMDTSLSVPKSNPVFRRRTMKFQGLKTRQLPPREFGDNLKILMDRKIAAFGRSVSIKDFVGKMDSLY